MPTYLGIEHDLWCPVPPGGHVLGQVPGVIDLRVGDSRQPEVADPEVAVGVQEEVGGLEIAVQTVGGVNVLEAADDLVEEVADVVVAQLLGAEQLEQVALHVRLDQVQILRAEGRKEMQNGLK